MSDDLDRVKADAVASLRVALMSGHGVDAALRRVFYQHPLFGFMLFVGAVWKRFHPDGDVREITALTARIRAKRAGDPLGFPAREAELVMRVALGEMALMPELAKVRMNGQEILIAVLGELFGQWRPEPDEVADLLAMTGDVVAHAGEAGQQAAPDLWPAFETWLENWFETGMHESPFAHGMPAVWPDEDRPPWDDPALDDETRLARYNREIAGDPANVSYLLNRGLLLSAMGRLDEAIADYGLAERIDPADPRATVGRGDCLQLMSRYDDALAEYDRVLQRDPRNHDAVAGRAGAYTGLGQLEQGLADINRAMDLDPGGREIVTDLIQRTVTYRLMGRLDDALADCDRAVALHPDSAAVRASRGEIFNVMERYEDALADFQEAVEREPGFAHAVGGRADAYRYLERYEEALASYDRAVELEPDNVLWIAGRGETYRELGRCEEALADFDRAVDLYPENLWAISSRGNVNRLMGRYAEALADHNRGLDLDPDEADIIADRGMTYQAMGRPDEAQADFARAIDLDASLRDELVPYLAPQGEVGTPKQDLPEADAS